MEKKIVIVVGKERDQYGMPISFYFYGIFASSYKKDKEDKDYIAINRIGVSQGIPSETEGVELVESPSEKDAMEKVIAELKNRFENESLKVRVFDFPETVI